MHTHTVFMHYTIFDHSHAQGEGAVAMMHSTGDAVDGQNIKNNSTYLVL